MGKRLSQFLLRSPAHRKEQIARLKYYHMHDRNGHVVPAPAQHQHPIRRLADNPQ